jgi:hypothetical protein
MNDNPYRTSTSTIEPEEAIPNFNAPVPWSRRHRLSVMALGCLALAYSVWGRLHGDDSAWIRMLAIKALLIIAGAVLMPVFDRWQARRNARAIARLVGEDV